MAAQRSAAGDNARMRLARAWLLALVVPALQAQTLTLHYQDRPPYSSTAPDGSAVGLVASPAVAALRRAGIAFVLAVTPSQRQLALIQSGQGLHCGMGWFRTPERAALGKFSRPLYRDRPLGALVRTGAGLASGGTAAGLLADTRFTLLVKDGYSYGPTLDALLAQAAARIERTSVDPAQMSLMLRSQRADWMIVAPEEAAVLGSPGLQLITFTDVPQGLSRHLYCGAYVPDAWLARIDQALSDLAPPAR
jgi:polar amino acid transport system substrate-binding protein